MLPRHVVLLLLLLASVAACSKAPPASAPSPDPSTASPTPPPPAPAPRERTAPITGTARVPSFAREIQPYLAMRCANDLGCHGERHTRHSRMDLRSGQAYSHLVGAASDIRKGALLVAPGDPDKSFLVDKLLGRKLGGREGTAMPRDPEDNRAVSPIPFDPEFIDYALLPWIRAGAPQN